MNANKAVIRRLPFGERDGSQGEHKSADKAFERKRVLNLAITHIVTASSVNLNTNRIPMEMK